MKIISWNVNGLRAIQRKGFLDWLQKEDPDIIALQEIKAHPEQLDEQILNPHGYHSIFNPAERKGYSGTAVYSKLKPKSFAFGIGDQKFDTEGRSIFIEMDNFSLFNIYFPNGKRSQERLNFKLEYYQKALEKFNDLRSKGHKLLITGDYNTAHHAIDLARPKQNENISGFLREERDWLDQLVENQYEDCFRMFNKDPNHYTWWSYRAASRERNVGWRIDYFFSDKSFSKQIKNCYHLNKVKGSDHCPVVLELK